MNLNLFRSSSIAVSVLAIVLWVVGIEGYFMAFVLWAGVVGYMVTDYMSNIAIRAVRKTTSPRANNVAIGMTIAFVLIAGGLGFMMTKPFAVHSFVILLGIAAIAFVAGIILMWMAVRRDMKELRAPGKMDEVVAAGFAALDKVMKS